MKAAHSLKSAPPHAGPARKDPRTIALDVIIGALAALVLLLGYSLLTRTLLRPPVDPSRSGPTPAETIQLDVLNGCGTSGAGTSFTTYLRARGYDVVEIRNYKNFDVQESLVIDRTGNRANAEKVAYALGIRKQNIVQQINPDYFVDVSVLIGRDYTNLKPSQ